ncbi:MAG: hypothetical protein HQK83_01495 [Fibrobacteria bacterium]|nr:hypothetical protein [Fibrobacteria bacterium]
MKILSNALLGTLLCILFASGQRDGFDKMNFSQQKSQFHTAKIVSQSAEFVSWIGAGLSITGLVLKNNNLIVPGAIVYTTGVSTNGFAGFAMHSAVGPYARITPNGWLWYAGGMVCGAILLGEVISDNPSKPVMWGTGGGAGLFSLMSWIRFHQFRKKLIKKFPEYAGDLQPVIMLTKSGNVALGLHSQISF